MLSRGIKAHARKAGLLRREAKLETELADDLPAGSLALRMTITVGADRSSVMLRILDRIKCGLQRCEPASQTAELVHQSLYQV